MRLTVLNVAYPFAPVGAHAVGGAEQVLSTLDAALVNAGHRSIVLACEGSHAHGEHIAMPRPCGDPENESAARLRLQYRLSINDAVERCGVDLVHMHGLDFHAYLPRKDVPVLATLHLPIGWYSPEALQPTRPDTWIHAVSQGQHAALAGSNRVLSPIENGALVEVPAGRHAKRKFALMLARICPEKGVHIAVDAAKRAGVPLLIGGEVFPFPEHQRYFAEQVQPRLDRWRRFIGAVAGARKRRLLAAARCLVVASLVPETSSLVAREALACGTPVVAFGKGALTETVVHGRTGYLVWDEVDMAKAIAGAEQIDPETCRRVARERFSREHMIDCYFERYARLARRPAARTGLVAA